MPTYLPASFGNMRLLVAVIDTERGRDIAIQSPATGNVHALTDRGLRAVIARCELLFVDQPGQADYKDRYHQFLELAEGTEPQIFTHPIDGAYLARAAELGAGADTGSRITVSCTFIRDEEPEQVFPAGAGVSTLAGVEAVTVAAAAAKAALSAAGLASTVAADAVATVTAWDDADDLDSNTVFLSVGALAAKIDAEVERLQLAADLSRWGVYKELVLLRDQLARTAESFTSNIAAVFDVVVTTSEPLRSICARLYGAAAADEKVTEVCKLNRVRTPARLPPGTYKFPRAA